MLNVINLIPSTNIDKYVKADLYYVRTLKDQKLHNIPYVYTNLTNIFIKIYVIVYVYIIRE